MTLRTTAVTIDVSKITCTQDVIKELGVLTDSLRGSDFRHLVVFNNAYLTVTETISKASQAKRFNNPEFIERFSVSFATYYFQAINMYFRGDPSLAPAWVRTIQPEHVKGRPLFVSLLMGANAHINYDLPLALADTIKNRGNNNFLKDISTIDRLLIKSGKQIVGEFEEPNPFVSFVKTKCRFLYFRPIMWMVLYWRVMAWRQYRSFKKNGIRVDQLSQRSTKIANKLMRVGACFS